jgi:A nuclease of the HNH/ENDO VII superfamily with conserved WHH
LASVFLNPFIDDVDAKSAELEEDDSEMTEGDQEESELPMTDTTVTQPKVMQLVKHKRQSNRIASYRQNNARRDRRRRAARNRDVIRFVPGARVRTFLVGGVAALGGGTGLQCPIGSYVRRQNNFNYTGSRAGDIAALGGTPRGYVWHHHHDFVSTGPNAGHGTMMLLRIVDHLPGHRGGVYQWNHTAAHGAYG